MTEGLLKLFTEEPEKLNKVIISILKFFNAFLLVQWFYLNYFGLANFVAYSDLNSFIAFLTTGRALLFILVFFTSYYLLDFITVYVLFALNTSIMWLSSKFPMDANLTEAFAKVFDIFRLKNGVIVKGGNFKLVYSLISNFNNELFYEEIKQEIKFQYNSILVSGTLIYFIILPENLHFGILNWVLLVLIFLMVLIEVVLEKMVEYIYPDLSHLVRSVEFCENSVHFL